MKFLKFVIAGVLAAILIPLMLHADVTNMMNSATNSATATKPKPDLLKTCPVSGEKLGEMGKPCVFVYKGQEVKLCCPMCKADFDKDPEKYIKIIQASAAK